MKTLSPILVLLLFMSCAPIRVNYDYERGTDFSTYKTYNYYQDLNTGLSELDTNRLLDALDAGLQAKGFSLSETPDFFINIVSDEYQEAQRNSVGVGMGGTGRNVGGGISIGIPIGQSSINRQIIFDFVDENGKGLFWQAVSESSYNPNATPEQRETKLKAIVDKVLSGYPPKK
ncbi:DUF4136 domain-containing protein [Geojedonia litorea]|uniref:DUF4136 domain-containing protein n=1 Tax=Geojedonia litorea TaxID=1268269 RepID=A0ABV9N380_9FLAO